MTQAERKIIDIRMSKMETKIDDGFEKVMDKIDEERKYNNETFVRKDVHQETQRSRRAFEAKVLTVLGIVIPIITTVAIWLTDK